MFKKYRLHHRKHTGKLLHHRHTHYPALFALMVIAGLLIFMTNRIASADDLLVTATVPAPIPAGTPTFTSPDEGAVVAEPSVQFTGTCPVITPAIIIALYEGSTLLGSATCQPDGSFTVTATLTGGAHTIVATVYTITGDTGQSSTPLHITYRPPATPETPTSPANPATPSSPLAHTGNPSTPIAPLDIIVVAQPYLTYARNVSGEWRGRINGGIPPYTIRIEWGDGKTDTYAASNNDLQAFTHAYGGSLDRTLKITVTDSHGNLLVREYAVRYTGAKPTGAKTNPLVTLFDGPPQDPLLAWIIIYLCLLATMLMMWRYEHTHYPRRVLGVPLHYSWQKGANKPKPHRL